MESAALLEKREDRIAVLTLNRPAALNAIDRAMVRALRDAIRDVESDSAIDVLVVTGAGERAFCVGVDLKERQTLSDEEAQRFRLNELFPMYSELERRTKPAIAVVNGYCLGGGFEIALCCDMILATQNAQFGLPEVKWGLIPAAGGCRKLPKLIGTMRAKELILTAKTIGAAEAARIGIVNRVVSAESRMQETFEVARSILDNAQIAVRAAKRCLDYDPDAERAAAFDLDAANLCYTAKERKEGVAKFAARKPASSRH